MESHHSPNPNDNASIAEERVIGNCLIHLTMAEDNNLVVIVFHRFIVKKNLRVIMVIIIVRK